MEATGSSMITDWLPAPLWCRAGSTHPRCSCTVGRAAVADSSRSLRPSPPPPECYQTGCGPESCQTCRTQFHVRLTEENPAVNTWWSGKQTDQSLILCSHSMMSFTCGGPPEPQSFRALKDIKVENVGSEGASAKINWPIINYLWYCNHVLSGLLLHLQQMYSTSKLISVILMRVYWGFLTTRCQHCYSSTYYLHWMIFAHCLVSCESGEYLVSK